VLGEVSATVAAGAAFWRYTALRRGNALLLEARVDAEALPETTEDDLALLEEGAQLEALSWTFLAGLSCLPYLNWLAWTFRALSLAQQQLLVAATEEEDEDEEEDEEAALAEGGGTWGWGWPYCLACAALYASPYVDLFGQRDLVQAIDGYVLVIGIVHLQLERLTAEVARDTRISVDQQWRDYYDKTNKSKSVEGDSGGGGGST